MRILKKIRTMLLSLALLTGLSLAASNLTALAAGSVTYDGNAQKFIFAPGSEYSPTDLFTEFKNVMPGDSLTEQIIIRSDAADGADIRVYMRSLGAQKDTDDFLAQLSLTVQQNGDSKLFEAPANETAQLTDWVYLGTVYSGGEIALDVTLNVPITMGNEYQDNIGYIDWQFKIEEIPQEPEPSEEPSEEPEEPGNMNIPQTGDTSNLPLYIILACAAALALIGLLVFIRRKKSEDN